jgi:hypothetical protein
MDKDRHRRVGHDAQGNPAERISVLQGAARYRRPPAVNDNAPSLAYRLLKLLRWVVILAVVLGIAWSLRH